jgi:hypothetical protein
LQERAAAAIHPRTGKAKVQKLPKEEAIKESIKDQGRVTNKQKSGKGGKAKDGCRRLQGES